MSAQKLNLMITNKTKCLELIDALTELEIVIEDRKKMNDSKILELKETEEMMKNVLNNLKKIKRMN